MNQAAPEGVAIKFQRTCPASIPLAPRKNEPFPEQTENPARSKSL